MKKICLCCDKNLPVEAPRSCPECGHIFQGNGWDGIDAHWKAKHENIMPYADFWSGLCSEHKSRAEPAVRKAWSRDELLLALELYYSEPFGRLHQRNPIVIKIAEAIGRTPSAVAMKACNFASLDPNIPQGGLSNASAGDKAIWNEFSNNGVVLLDEVSNLKEKIAIADESPEDEFKEFVGDTEIVREVKARRAQKFFRKSVMISYENRCAISGINIPELLIASHIIPWAESEARRVDPTNGIALNALYDKAFDIGLISIDASYRVIVSKTIKELELGESDLCQLFAIEGRELIMPYRFVPDQVALAWHRENRFRN